MMEIQRLKSLKEQEDREAVRKAARQQGAQVIVDQIHERHHIQLIFICKSHNLVFLGIFLKKNQSVKCRIFFPNLNFSNLNRNLIALKMNGFFIV